MLKTRSKRLADHSGRAIQRLAEIEASILSLNDDDLLDLADIFKEKPATPLGLVSSKEVARRQLVI
jgi:hypothetical protein